MSEEIKKKSEEDAVLKGAEGAPDSEDVRAEESAEKGEVKAPVSENETSDADTWRKRYLDAERKYRALLDMKTLSGEFDVLADMQSTDELPASEDYERLRDMGFSAREAFLATSSDLVLRAPSKNHLHSVVTRRASSPFSMSDEEYAVIKAVFGDSLSDERIAELYRRVKA